MHLQSLTRFFNKINIDSVVTDCHLGTGAGGRFVWGGRGNGSLHVSLTDSTRLIVKTERMLQPTVSLALSSGLLKRPVAYVCICIHMHVFLRRPPNTEWPFLHIPDIGSQPDPMPQQLRLSIEGIVDLSNNGVESVHRCKESAFRK